jgi:hypothetical protein
MKIELRTLGDGEEHACGYVTSGDWRKLGEGKFLCTVNQLSTSDREFVILLHEIVEAYLCSKRGVQAEAVEAHDRMFELERAAGKHSDVAEPGDDERAPYRREHQFSTLIEMLVLHELGDSWPEHCKEVAESA